MGLINFLKSKVNKIKGKKVQSSKVRVPIKVSLSTEEISNEVIPIEERIKDKKPNPGGLYPHEILVLSYAHTFYTDGNNSFQRFWWYRYGIEDVNKVLESLLNRGFIKVASIENAMYKATVVELKDILRENELKVSGKKEILINRLLDEVDKEKLNNIFNRRTYEITELGEEILKSNEHIPYIHSRFIENLDIFSLNELVKDKKPGYSYKDVIWGYLNKRSIELISEGKFGLYRNCRLTMYDFLIERNKDNKSFYLLLEVIRYDLSGLSNNFDLKFLNMYRESFFPYESSIIKIAPGIIQRIIEYKNSKGLLDQELKNEIIERGRDIKLPYSVFTIEECADIVLMEIHEDKDGLIKLYKEVEKRFDKETRF